MDNIAAELGWSSYSQGMVDSWHGSNHARKEDYVAEEVPIVLVYNNQPHVVMLTTPLDLEDFALGFSLTEGIIRHRSELHSVRVVQRAKGIEVRMRIPEQRFSCILDKGRNMTGRTGCGLCGATTLEQAIRQPPPVGRGPVVDAEQMMSALGAMRDKQSLNQLTGSVHATAWLALDQGITMIREDIGRHNALDKLIGALTKSEADFDRGCLLITSRASYEMVQKAASVGITVMAAISAPTALAIKLARECGLTLVGYARNDNHVIYTHPHRIQHYQTIAS
ncbi:formate dehydrogenase accessory sulfurtransferase FdhD [Methylomarinum sp. Ch1-1]|uniref:Sulfur carrier protein FdhD n=1 Tax=Methylomarinum roseum TaxID=3067653 RepID=A0AAU7NWR3_9GAMM|nr:formate dehydrogenase accessory sulfurtransferase FdhD [Methylomarinum sp. Ch1-1]MDP4522541.1 formate dehydrogenase accessory sulfurtransferase FdhD [Methylomarinum sp. Ch1-1]